MKSAKRIATLLLALCMLAAMMTVTASATFYCKHNFCVEVCGSKVPATCETEGSYVLKCFFCCETKTITTEPLGHDFVVTEEKEPTCTEDGFVTCVCTRCCKEVTETTAPAAGHSFVPYTIDPTCTEDGCTGLICTVCEDVADVEIIPAAGHKFGKWHVVREASEKHEGLKVRTCKVCGETEEIVLPKLPPVVRPHRHNSQNIPQTGDTANNMLWVSMIAAAVVVLMTALFIKKPQNNMR